MAAAEVTREQLIWGVDLSGLAQELQRDAICECLKRLGADCALSCPEILQNLEDARSGVVDFPASAATRASALQDIACEGDSATDMVATG